MGALATYNSIVISADPKGHMFEGLCDGALKPGTVVQVKTSTEKVNGRFTYSPYSRDADGNNPRGPIVVVLEDQAQGKLPGDAYADGAICRLYVPLPGDELMMLLQDVSGTADTHIIGEILMVDSGTGTLIATTGSPEKESFVNLETLAALSADTFSHTMFAG